MTGLDGGLSCDKPLPIMRPVPFLRTAALFVLAVSVAFFADAAKKPNFIIILADDLGYGDLGCYGQGWHPRRVRVWNSRSASSCRQSG